MDCFTGELIVYSADEYNKFYAEIVNDENKYYQKNNKHITFNFSILQNILEIFEYHFDVLIKSFVKQDNNEQDMFEKLTVLANNILSEIKTIKNNIITIKSFNNIIIKTKSYAIAIQKVKEINKCIKKYNLQQSFDTIIAHIKTIIWIYASNEIKTSEYNKFIYNPLLEIESSLIITSIQMNCLIHYIEGITAMK